MKTQLEPNPALFLAERYKLSSPAGNKIPTRRDFYKIWFTETNGLLHHSHSLTSISQPAVIFLHPLVDYSFESTLAERSGFWAIFNIDFIFDAKISYATLFSSNQASIYFPDEEAIQRIDFLFRQVIQDLNSDYINRYDSIRNVIHLLLHEGLKGQSVTSTSIKQNASSRLTSQFLNLLEQQFPVTSPHKPLRIKTPGAFAADLAVHVNHLNAVVYQITGKSTSKHIAERLISESKSLLQYTDWTISDIAYALGFDYPNHFSAFFKKHTSQAPTSWRI